MMSKITKDRGASAILVTASLMVLMGVAAVVVDGGLGFSERRQAQSGVDFGSLAALQFAVSCPSPCTEQAAANAGAAEAEARVAANLPGRSLDWSACTDPTRPSEYVWIAAGNQCVSFTENFDKSRVVLPDDAISTTFGRVIGFDQLTIGAFAEAGQERTIKVKAIPHTPTGISGAEGCLLSNQAPQAIEPCSGAASGFYGYLDVALFGEDPPHGTPSTCNNGDTNLRIAINMAKGSDHNMVPWDPGPPPDDVINDHAACPITGEDVNELRVETGSPTGGVTDGLFDGVSGSINGEPITASQGRLICDLTEYSTECATVRGRSIDHTGLWEFLDGGCSGGVDTHDEMKDCLENDTPTFVDSIIGHPRLAAIPIFHTTPTGPGNYKIKEFIPVWLERTYYDCNSNRCDTIHSPGETFPGPPPGTPPSCPADLAAEPGTDNCDWSDTSGPDDVEGLTAFIMDMSMFSADFQDVFPGQKGARIYNLTR